MCGSFLLLWQSGMILNGELFFGFVDFGHHLLCISLFVKGNIACKIFSIFEILSTCLLHLQEASIMGLGDVFTLGSRAAGEVCHAHTSSMSLHAFLSLLIMLCDEMHFISAHKIDSQQRLMKPNYLYS
jgi:hypothetical protein